MSILLFWTTVPRNTHLSMSISDCSEPLCHEIHTFLCLSLTVLNYCAMKYTPFYVYLWLFWTSVPWNTHLSMSILLFWTSVPWNTHLSMSISDCSEPLCHEIHTFLCLSYCSEPLCHKIHTFLCLSLTVLNLCATKYTPFYVYLWLFWTSVPRNTHLSLSISDCSELLCHEIHTFLCLSLTVLNHCATKYTPFYVYLSLFWTTVPWNTHLSLSILLFWTTVPRNTHLSMSISYCLEPLCHEIHTFLCLSLTVLNYCAMKYTPFYVYLWLFWTTVPWNTHLSMSISDCSEPLCHEIHTFLCLSYCSELLCHEIHTFLCLSYCSEPLCHEIHTSLCLSLTVLNYCAMKYTPFYVYLSLFWTSVPWNTHLSMSILLFWTSVPWNTHLSMSISYYLEPLCHEIHTFLCLSLTVLNLCAMKYTPFYVYLTVLNLCAMKYTPFYVYLLLSWTTVPWNTHLSMSISDCSEPLCHEIHTFLCLSLTVLNLCAMKYTPFYVSHLSMSISYWLEPHWTTSRTQPISIQHAWLWLLRLLFPISYRGRHGTGEKKMMRGSGGCSRPPVGSRGKAPGKGLGATPPEAEGFFCMSSQKTAFWSMKIRYLQVSKLYV